jgi:hypothetical protein
MPTTTPLNGWPVPVSTDLVKDGAVAIESLGDAIDASVGEGLLAWKTYTPTLSFGWANGNGAWTARYVQIGKTVHVNAYFVIGSTTTKGAGCNISLPVSPFNTANNTNNNIYGIIAGNTYPLGLVNLGTSSVGVKTVVANGIYAIYNDLSGSTPAAWNTNDVIYFGITYQAA